MSDGELWVFGYGSLMWQPGFSHIESRSALLRGYHRAFAMRSTIAWGSPERPGLVATLLPGGACRGMVFRVGPGERQAVLAYLDRRERAYRRRHLRVVHDGGATRALTYVADASHPNFVGKLLAHEAARLVHQGVGTSGSSRDYLANAVAHLDGLGIAGTAAHALLDLVETLDGDAGAP